MVLRTDGYLGYFLAAALLLSPLDKVTVSVINFSELTELLKNIVKGVLTGNLTFLFIKALYLQMT